MPNVVTIATWPFGRIAAEKTTPLLNQGKPALDAVIAGAQAVEDDPEVTSVGYAGLPNAIGTVALDSCVMDGKTLNCGGVAALENIRHAAAVARLVMEKTPHLLLVGQGAQQFALQHGFELTSMLTPESLKKWEESRPDKNKAKACADAGEPWDEDDHDTVTVLGLDKSNSLGGVCTTSGLAHKLSGRVGDSPLIGSGLYVDDEAGAAGATGVGEEIIRIGGSFFVVEQMRAGKTPQQACEIAVKRVNEVAVRRGVHPSRVAFLALNRKGEIGACCTERTNFVYAVGRPGKIEMLKAKEIGPEQK